MSNQSDRELIQLTNSFRLAGSESAANSPEKLPVPEKLRLEAVREKLAHARGKQYWRTLDELAGTPEFAEMMQREFSRHASEWVDPVSRRNFMKLMGASMALAGLSACTKQPYEAIVPYVRQPEDLIPGKPMLFATANPLPTGAVPVLVKSHEFRPTKIEGNPQHPLNGGQADVPGAIAPADAITQASVLDLWDPDRSQTTTFEGEPKNWALFQAAIRNQIGALKSSRGAGLRFLTGTVLSPTLADQLQGVLQTYPEAKWYQYDPINRDNARTGLKTVFGRYVDARYKLDAADVIVSLDADFLSGAHFPGFLQLSRQYVSRRKDPAQAKMNRLYVVESTMTTTGAKAEHRLALRAGDIEPFAAALAAALGVNVANGSLPSVHAKYFNALVDDLKASHGACVVIPGEYQSANVHALAALINQALGNIGKTVSYGDPIEVVPTEQLAGFKELVGDMNAGKVSLLVMLGVNPVYSAPADLDFESALQKVANDKEKTAIHLGLYKDETAELSQWHVHEAHYLEAWSDARAYDGTASILQPLIEPLYGGHSAHEVVQLFSDQPGINSYDLLRNYWRSRLKGEFEGAWRRAVHDGFIAGTAVSEVSATPHAAALQIATPAKGLEVSFRPDPSIYDGRFANNGWLQEVPKPITKLTWDNAVIVSINTAEKLSVLENQVLELELDGEKVKGTPSVLILPGQPDDTVTVYLGHGRTQSGRVGTGTGFNAYSIRKSDAPYFASGLKVDKTGEEYRLAITTSHYIIPESKVKVPLEDADKRDPSELVSEPGEEARGRELIRVATLEEFEKYPNFAHEDSNHKKLEEPSTGITLYKPEDFAKPNPDYAWGMAIDLNSCVGCNACVVACVSENNIAVVGKEQVARGRAMHWLRVDTYFEGDAHNPTAHFQPLPCQQCENAPCEPVCPVGATVHSPEGLNNMVYNRCVGTRYCSNNCPYKVRHFNFILFSDYTTQSLVGLRNPDVTVRSRGVMEKCTYCVQRINAARIQAEKDNRDIRDGEIVTACQETCPTSAITFGNIHDEGSKVSKLKAELKAKDGKPYTRNYSLLAEVNTRPRTTYIAGVTNPNPALESNAEKPENS